MREQELLGKEALRSAEAAELLHVSPKTVSRWAKEGKLPYIKTLGGHRRFPTADLRPVLAALRVAVSPEGS